MARFTSLQVLFDGTTATTAGTAANIFDVSARRLMSLQLTNTGSQTGVFELQISDDGTNFVLYNRLTTNVTNTNAQTDIGVSSVSVSANTSVIYFIRAGDSFRSVRGSASMVSGGSLTAVLHGLD